MLSGDNLASQKDDLNVTGLIVGVVFGSAASVVLVLAGWFVLKKFCWAGRLPHTFN